jgi:hypothetical protein
VGIGGVGDVAQVVELLPSKCKALRFKLRYYLTPKELIFMVIF